ncbi:MAG: glycosyltransferase family 4 protein [Chloroflexi bacterium]|nr:glycosyltransferase family 4 protein [Chloroflexota bacterium]
MKIVLLHYASPPVVGGVETVLARQALLLTHAGHQVSILAGRGATWDARIPVETLPRIDSRHPEVLKVKASLDQGVIPPEFEALVQQIERDLKRSLAGVDAVIAHNVASLHKNLALTVALYNLSQQPGAFKLILWHHDLAWTAPRYLPELHPGWPWDLLRQAWPGARQVTVSYARLKELAELMGLPEDQVTVVPAGLDLDEFLGLHPRTVTLLEALQLHAAGPLLLAPVRVTRRKNLELAIASLAELREKMPHAQLIITGPPGAHNPSNLDYLASLQAQRSRLGLEGCVHLLAEFLPDGLPEECVADFYRIADALLLPSREEGFGIPMLEAGLSRLPIFCSRLDALHALAGEWATYFSPDDSPRQVAALIAGRLEKDPAFRLRVQIRQAYTWQAVYETRIAPLLENHENGNT